MTSEPTKFAPAHRASQDSIAADHALVLSQVSLVKFLSAVSSMVAVLNPERQIVYASETFLHFRGLTAMAPLLGKRPGEALNCTHADDEVGGCGTSEGCSVCGALEAILESSRQKTKQSRECRLTVLSPDRQGSLDLEVTSTPWALDDREFTVLTVRDIAEEKRRKSLERIFFHDIVNTAGGLAGLLELLIDYPDLNEGKDLVGMSQRSSQDILEEILSFQQLKMAESGDLQVRRVVLDPHEVLQEVADKLRFHQVAVDRTVVVAPVLAPVVAPKEHEARLVTDRLLLERVLGNMLKNALEATPLGGCVTLSCRPDGGRLTFSVHNPGTMPREVQLQVFQRSFSTKNPDRGVGTYSMRLLGETYLGGTVSFQSDAEGTVFFLTLPQGEL